MNSTQLVTSSQSTRTATPANEVLPAKEQQQADTKDSMPQLFIQRKLSIGAPDDPLEKEADSMADKVMRMPMPEPISFSSAKNSVYRKCTHCEEEEKDLQRKESNNDSTSIVPPIVHDVLNSSDGKPLDPDTRSFMEPRFNYDFSNVKVHDNEIAAKSASSINALAYTSGNDIVFNSRQYNTKSDSGKRLLAHELTHVIQQGNNVNLKVQRFSQTQTLTESGKKITVERIVKPGACKIIPESRINSDYGVTAEKSFFSYSNCRGGRSIETAGELNYSEFVTNTGNFVSRLLNNPNTPFNTLLNQTVGSSALKGNLSFVLRINTFRMELSSKGSITPSGNMEGNISGLIRYTNGKFGIELSGDTTAIKDGLQTGRVSNLTFNTDLGPLEIRFNLTQGKRLGATSDSLTVDGLVSYRPSSTAYGVGVNVQQVDGNTQVIFSFRVNLGGKIQEEKSPDCNTCVCSDPKITYQCWEKSQDAPEPDPEPTPKMLPYYFNYANTESRPDWIKQNSDTITQIVELIKQGYSISGIEGYCSPEGEAKLEKPTRSGFPGNEKLSKLRAEKSRDDIKARLTANASLMSDNRPAGKQALERISASLNSDYHVIGLGELFGSNNKGEVKRLDLFKHLTSTLKTPTDKDADPLKLANVTGGKLPAEVNEAATRDIEEFRTGVNADDKTKKLTQDQRLEELYKWLRRSLIYLSPPKKAERKLSDLKLPLDFYGSPTDCTEKHKNIFTGVTIPSEELFINNCDKK